MQCECGGYISSDVLRAFAMDLDFETDMPLICNVCNPTFAAPSSALSPSRSEQKLEKNGDDENDKDSGW